MRVDFARSGHRVGSAQCHEDRGSRVAERSDGSMRWRPSPAMVVALIALFVAITGVGYAVSKIPKNSVKSKQIKDGEVKSVDVADDGLTGTDIDEATLNVQGAPGPKGATGAQGAQGDQGPAGLSNGAA